MPGPAVPVALATLAACGSLVTSIKSGWELSRMARKKLEQQAAAADAAYVYRKLRKAYHEGLMSEAEYDKWYERFLVAKAERDPSALRKIRAHLRLVNNGGHRQLWAPSSARPARRRYGDDDDDDDDVYVYATPATYKQQQRRRSVAFDTDRTTYYCENAEWPPSGASIEFFPRDDEKVQLARLQRRSSVSYPRSGGGVSSSSSAGSSTGGGSTRGYVQERRLSMSVGDHGHRGGRARSVERGEAGRGRGRGRWEESDGDDGEINEILDARREHATVGSRRR